MKVLTEELALKAANLYSEGLSFGKISEELEVSKSRVGDLIRGGIFSMANNTNHDETLEELPVVLVKDEQENAEEPMDYRRRSLQDVTPKSYTLETSGTPKRVTLTPKALMIFDIFCSCGFEGDLSDFIEDSIDYMYQTRKPADRSNHGVI